ncbi:hypothetical protein T11_7834 [Trichinella zimbabwensis]|uniref:Uncharacterized protein n=1 Tax=Trichinella zimbabwensis TaxID=268475 RepID=A0A0V1GHG8_9BILA|nr:hypothetical protein T11_7834 [Trichinella zimbabwensis]
MTAELICRDELGHIKDRERKTCIYVETNNM